MSILDCLQSDPSCRSLGNDGATFAQLCALQGCVGRAPRDRKGRRLLE